MNLIDLLIRDHEKVLALFDSFEAVDANEADERRGLVARIHDELEDHAGVEEQLFYPAVEARASERGGSEHEVETAHEEHRLIRELLGELTELTPDDERYDAKVKVARDLVRRHVEEEEGRLLPQARQLLSAEELDSMGARVEADRAQLRTELMATAAPDADVPPPDDGPPSDWTLSEDVMGMPSAPPQAIHSDDPIRKERSNRAAESSDDQSGNRRARKERP